MFQKDRTGTTASARRPSEGMLTVVRVHGASKSDCQGAGEPRLPLLPSPPPSLLAAGEKLPVSVRATYFPSTPLP